MKHRHRFTFELSNKNHPYWNFFDSHAISSLKIPEFKNRKWGSLVASYYDIGNEDFDNWIKQITETPDNLGFYHDYIGTLAYLNEKGHCIDSSKFELILESINFSTLDYLSNDPLTVSLEFKVVNLIHRV